MNALLLFLLEIGGIVICCEKTEKVRVKYKSYPTISQCYPILNAYVLCPDTDKLKKFISIVLSVMLLILLKIFSEIHSTFIYSFVVLCCVQQPGLYCDG